MKMLNQTQPGRAAMLVVLVVALWMSGVTEAYSQQVSYTMTRDNPEEAVVDMYIGLDPLWMELGGQNVLSMGWGVYGFYNIDQKLMFEADLKLPYTRRWIDATYLSVHEKGKSSEQNFFNDYKPTMLTMFNATASWTFASKTRTNRPMKIVVDQSTSGNVTTTKSLNVRGTKKRLYQLRGGTFYNKTTVSDKVNAPEGFGESTLPGLPVDPNPVTKSPAYTNMQYTSLNGGIQISRVWETSVDIEGWGSRTSRAHTTWYFDAMFAPIIRVRELKSGGDTYNLIQNNEFSRQKLGWRMGWAARPDYKNMVWGMEWGNRPHITALGEGGAKVDDFSRGAYFNFWMIISIYNKL